VSTRTTTSLFFNVW